MTSSNDKRFDLHRPRDLLRKLNWEIEQLVNNPFATGDDDAYRAWNCAVTAWHISDWTWQALDAASKDYIRQLSPAPNSRGATPLQTLVMNECREVAICRQLATGAKHFTIDQYNDPQVSSRREPGVNVIWSANEDTFLHIPGNVLFVYDGDRSYAPAALFRFAKEYWEAFLPRVSL